MITVHTLVKNEEIFLWYSISSVISFVDRILIWDTGSSDATVEIVKELVKKYGDKIEYKEIGSVDEREYSNIRQKMLDETKSGWVFILDGDEIWYENSIKKVKSEIENSKDKYECIIVPTINVVGDIFHFQEKEAGKYKFGNRVGHYNLRFINRNIPGLHVDNIYGKEGYFDENDKPIQDRDESKILFLDTPYLHTTHLERSSKDEVVMQRKNKLKHEIGIPFPVDFYYPEALFMERPHSIPNVWRKMDLKFKLQACIETPLRKIKRRFT